jgi:hypothetical protein
VAQYLRKQKNEVAVSMALKPWGHGSDVLKHSQSVDFIKGSSWQAKASALDTA